jgi:hypothetical protein
MHRVQSLRPYTPPPDVLDISGASSMPQEEGGIFQLTTLRTSSVTARASGSSRS